MQTVTPHEPPSALATKQSAAVSGPRASAKYAVEAIGTFFLVFTVGAAVGSHSALAPLGIGAALMVIGLTPIG